MNSDWPKFINALANLETINLKYYQAALSSELPELNAMAECPQDAVWHAEGDVLIHTQMVMDEALKEMSNATYLSQTDKQIIYLAALLHDVGKPQSTYQTLQGRVVSPGHSGNGIDIARKILRKMGLPFELREAVLMLVLRHMLPYRMVTRITPNYTIYGINIEAKQYARLSAEVRVPTLYHLTRADWLGRQGKGVAEVLANLEIFRSRCEEHNYWNNSAANLLSEQQFIELGIEDPWERRRINHYLLHLQLVGRIQTVTAAYNHLKESESLRSPGKGHLYIPIGIPGCGKSTWLTKNLSDAKIVSSDQKRIELFGDENFQGDNAYVFKQCFLDVENALKAGKTVALDATNVRYKQRLPFLNLARQLFAHTTIVYFDLPLELAISRNSQRQRQVPAAIIARYYDTLQVPHVYEAQEIKVVSDQTTGWWPQPVT